MSLKSAFATFGRSILRKGIWHWVRFAILLVVAYFAGHALKKLPQLTGFRYWIYRHQIQMQHGAPDYPRRTAVVAIEDTDFWGPEFAGRSPLRRDLIAKILDKLRLAGVNIVVLDIDLRSPDPTLKNLDFETYKHEDDTLTDAIKAMCTAGQSLVIAASVRGKTIPVTKMPSIYSQKVANDPKAYSCMSEGYIQLPFDLRQVPGQIAIANGPPLDSLSLAAVKIADPIAYNAAITHPERGFRYGRYLSESEYSAHGETRFRYSWSDLQGARPEDLRKELADKVVLIGGAWHTYANNQGPEVDQKNSPMGPMAGVFIHANYIEALYGERGTFAPVSDLSVELLELTLAVALALIGALEIHAGWKWGAFAASCAISFVLTYVLLENLGVFLDFLVPMFILIGHTLVEEFLATRHELHRLKHHAAEGPG
jgi:CHASE2 domain-containing sensor protein